ncbi:hypothetical protein ACM61V_01040 [Sphingomonas sp. TX0543]|uniref:hypothetical protein n=1 Tax=unclassified Sphingomonas TaxID=196159 RepID=UPI0010F68E54|nr:hypothetical protein [Sphingomonas sp. 3P27F8]
MRMILIPLAAAAIGAGAIAIAAPGNRNDRAAADEAAFQKEVSGLVPGKPVDCIGTRLNNGSVKAIGSRLIYRINSKRVYVNETNGGCEAVARGDALVTRQFSTQLCRGDIARTVNMPARIDSGTCTMGSFIPYQAR